ncbi:PAS domain S-box protein [Deinococcus marmoris]|uniref:HD-hydrolase domain n=1 Tax=Deinococcus marmoris TaxID=249408 RepID=A0A1U7NY66_9DEIO|nr:PAS domain S-box protein [Deinococcus marmoris]OLV17844.1 HD-hydrolase domain [Deinococcus marmoris]
MEDHPPSPDLHLLSQAFTASVTGVIITDAQQPDLPIIFVNPAFERLSGYLAAEIIGRNCRFLQGQDRDQEARQEILDALSEGHSVTTVLRNYRKDGSLFYNELTLSPIHDASGTLTHYLGFQNDVTAREQARQQESRSRRQLTSILERITDGFVSFDQHWNITYVNAAAAAMTARPSSETLGQNLFTFSPLSTHSPLGLALQKAQESGIVQHLLNHSGMGKQTNITIYPGENGVSMFIRDVTESREAQREQQASEERFAKVFEAAPVAIIVSQLSTGHCIDVNPEFLRQSGYTREEVIGRDSLDLNFWVVPLEAEDLRRILREEGKVLDRELQFRLKSGAVADTTVSAIPMTMGGEACIVTLLRDVTVEKQAQRFLADSEERYRNIATQLQRTLDLSLDLINSIDAEGRFVTISAACQQILGYTPEELIGRTYLDFVHPDDRAITVREDAHITAGQATTTFQNRYLHKNGSVVWLEWAAVSLPDDSLMYCVARNITERRVAEEDQAFLAAIVQASHNAIIGVSLDNTIRSWNPGAEELYGYTAEEAIGQPVTFIVPADFHALELESMERARQGFRDPPFEGNRVTKSGQQLQVRVTISPILDAAGQVIGVSKIARDITALRTAEQEIQVLNEDLQRQLRSITGLRKIDHSIAASADLDVTLGLVLDSIRQQLGMDAATVLLFDPHRKTLTYTVTRGLYTARLENSATKLGVGLAGSAALIQQPISLPDLIHASVLPAWRDVVKKEGLTAYHAVPLLSKGQVVGVIEVLHHQPWPLSLEWLSTLETLADQAAIAIDHARLVTELERSNVELRSAYDETIEGWARALDLRDHETEGHSRRVTEMTHELCQALGFTSDQLMQVRRGALLHDIGKMGIPDAVLLKPGKLTEDEWVLMKKHPEYAAELLTPIEFLHPALEIPQNHHEKWDGSGYPQGLKGEAIPLSARAFAVVDVYDALMSDRPYRKAWTREKTMDHIQSGSGLHFDPEVVDAFLQMIGQH